MYVLKELNNRLKDTLKVIFPTYHVFFFDVNLLDIILLLGCILIPQIWNYEGIEFFPYIAFVLVVHELGHLIAMKHFEYKKLKMIFLGPLALAMGEKGKTNPNEELIIFLAGPVPGIVLGFMLLLSSLFLNIPDNENIYFFLIVINGFNLLPLFPLDGGQLFKLMFFQREKESLIFLACSLAGLIGLQFYIFDIGLLIISVFILSILLLDLYIYLNKIQIEEEQDSDRKPISKRRKVTFVLIWCLFFFSAVVYFLNPA